MKRITFVNQYYSPLKNPPAKRLSAFAEFFASKGHDVKVITGHPNYPDGKLHKGYNGVFKKEKINGVKVYRFLEIPLANRGFFKRIINYISFAISSALFSFPIVLKSDIMFISSPPIFGAIPLFLISKLFRKKIIFDVRDLWPESATEVVGVKKSNIFYKILFSIVSKMYSKSDLIIVVTDEMGKVLKKRGYKNIYTVPNFASIKKFTSVKNKKIKIAYTGIITRAQDFRKYLNSDFEWHIAGTGDDLESLKSYVKLHKFKNIFFYGYQDKEFCDKLIASCDIGFIPLAHKKIFKMALPSKTFEYLSMGKPIFGVWSDELKNLVLRYDVGFFDSLDKVSFARLEQMSKNASKLFKSRFEKNVVCLKLFSLVEGLK